MNEQPRPTVIDLLSLRPDEVVVNVQPYRVTTKKPRKWQFWAKEDIKYNLAILTNQHRFFILDPDTVSLEEKTN